MTWFRLDDDVVNDPKVQSLSGELFKAWINILCLASKGGGVLPTVDGIAFGLRVKPAKAEHIVSSLRKADLLDEEDGVSRPHNWNGRQHRSDVSTSRVQRFRKRQPKRHETVSETSPEQNRAEQKQNRAERDAANAVSPSAKSYAFEAGVIRLLDKDFNQWKAAYQHLDLEAELLSLAEWAEQQRSWFNAVKGALAKRNREARDRNSRNGESRDEVDPRLV
jgi:hypothetical protein